MNLSSRGRFLASACGASLLAIVASGTACAQTTAAAQQEAAPEGQATTTEAGGNEEIIVTATKQGAVALQKVPASISVVTGAVLEQQNLRSTEDVAKLTPSLQLAKANEGDLQFIVRGIQSPGASTVGVYLDETVISGSNFDDGGGRTPDLGAYDISQVEILKGPQGTLFGASSLSGTVRIITNKPDTQAFSGSISGTISGTKDGGTNYLGDAMLNVPVVKDGLAVRGVFWRESYDGYIDAYYGLNAGRLVKNANSSDKTGGRLSVRMTPTDTVTVDGFYSRQKTTVRGPMGDTAERSGNLNPVVVLRGAPFLVGRTVPALPGPVGERIYTAPATSGAESDVELYGATATWDTGVGTLLATVSQYDLNFKDGVDVTGSATQFGVLNIPLFFGTGQLRPLGPSRANQSQTREIFTSEVRFSSDFDGPFNFVTGASYQEEEGDTVLTVLVADSVTGEPACFSWSECIQNVNSAGARSLLFATQAQRSVSAIAAFANGNLELTDRLTLNAGVRYYHADLRNRSYTLQAFQGSIPPATPPANGGPVQTTPILGLDGKGKEEKVTWSGTISYELADDKLVYFRAATGFRGGGINDFNSARQLGVTIPESFEPDTVLNLEVGAKTSFLDKRLTINTALFHMSWKGIQVSSTDSTGAVNFLSNGADAHINGAELEIFARPTDQLSLTIGGTLLRAKLSTDQVLLNRQLFTDVPPLGEEGDRIPRVPNFSLSARAAYTVPGDVIGGVETSFDATFFYVGSSYTQFSSDFGRDYQRIGDYATLNLGANFDYDETLSLRLFVNNVTDTAGEVDRFINGANVSPRITNRPRTIGATLRAKF